MTSRLILFFSFFILHLTTAHAGSLKISLLLGDTNSKASIEAIKAIKKEYPSLDTVSFCIYPLKDIRNRDLNHLKESDLVIILTMGRLLSDAVRPELVEVIKDGGKVYAVGGTYDDDHKQMGLLIDERIIEYYNAGGIENLKNMLLYALKKDFGFELSYGGVVEVSDPGIYEYKTKKIFESLEDYKKGYPSYREGKPWVGILFYRNSVTSGQTQVVDTIIEGLEAEGLNVLPVYGFPSETALERFFFDENGKSRVRLIIGIGMKMSVNPQVAIPLLSRLNVPVINAITLYIQSEKEWRESPVGLDIFERAWQVAQPEMAGIIQPIVIASKERMIDKDTGIEYIEEQLITERINRLIERVKAWLNLQDKSNKDKRVAIIYYNYPPGKQNISASYLNVLPESLWEILNKLRIEGYNVGDEEIDKDALFNDIFNYARNIGNWAQGELDRLVKTGKPVLIPIDTYKRWFEELPEDLKKAVLKDWGPVEESNIMVWQDGNGMKYIVIPAVRYGNMLFMPQPSKAWEQDVKKLYDDITIPPHHQYVAFYLWLKKDFKADAIAHIGTHGTHEWLSGKEVGFTEGDPPEALIQDLPNIYPYIVDNVGEGLQAKRRGMAVIIDHMTPPFDKAGLNKELRELSSLINDYSVAKEKSLSLSESKLAEVNNLARKIGLLKDLGIEEIKREDEIEDVGHYIQEIGEKLTPFGLHTFGKSPEERYRKATVEAILSIEKGLSSEEKKKRAIEIEDRIIRSGQSELDSFIAALSGRYVPAGQGNDPIRNPDSLPTGKNFYSFDPTRLPSKMTYEMGIRLAKELIEGYKERHGIYPDKLTFNLWGTETIRNEGVMESQIMYLMGIKPRWDERGRVIGVRAIHREELGRQRIDVVIIPSGLYRDLFSNLISLLDKAVTLAKEQDDEDNIIKENVLKTKEMLMGKGILEGEAERLATVRIFTEPSGAYGTNLDKVISMSNTWDNEKEVIDVYFMRMSYLYGQGFWGDKIEQKSSGSEIKEDISLNIFKNAISGTKVAIHSRSGNTYATLDNDDFFQYLGGTAMAVRAVDGKTPEVYVTDMSNPNNLKQETLEKFIGSEMRARYLNPEWIKTMMGEGYAGAGFIDKVIEHLWGWQVTVPEAIDEAKWNEIYETYVLDRNGLDIKEMFRQSRNPWAYQSLVARMLETIRKGYWKPDEKVIETLAREYAESVKEASLACCDHTCNNPLLTEFTSSVLISVPGLERENEVFRKSLDTIRNPVQQPKSGPDGEGKKVEGYEMEDVTPRGSSSQPIPYLFLTGFLILVTCLVIGWRRKII